MNTQPVLIDRIANPGGRLYPAAVCLQAILDARADHYPIHFLENVSGHPYGWFYLNTLLPGIGRSVCMTPGTEMTNSVKLALDNLGYAYEHFLSDAWDETWAHIVEAVNAGEPLLFGPLAYTALKYQRTAWRAPAEASHYVVVVGYDDVGHIYFHDPNGYSFVRFPVEEFQTACTNEVMIPSTARYSYIRVGERLRQPSFDEIITRVLRTAAQSFADQTVRRYGYRGILALQHYAEDLGSCLGATDLTTQRLLFSKMAYYFYPKGNQTRTDAAVFMRDAARVRPELAEPLQRFADAFTRAAMHYADASTLATRVIVEFNEATVHQALPPLQAETFAVLAAEREARDHLLVACARVEPERMAV